MIDAMDQRIVEWVGKFARPAAVFLAAPDGMQGKKGVSVYLLELVSSPPPRGVQRPPLSISVRYLITTWLDELQKSHRLLGELMFAAMEETGFEVESAALPLSAWQAFGVPPRPSLLLKVPLNKPRPQAQAPRVRGRLSVQFGEIRPLRGQVVGPGKVPIMAATVTLPSLQLTTRTDHNGRFYFPTVPGDPPVSRIQINARGREVSLPIPPRGAGEPVVLELNETQL